MGRIFSVILALFLGGAQALAGEPSPFDIDLTPDSAAIESAAQPAKSVLSQTPSPVSTAVQNLNPDISFVGDFVGGNPAAFSQKGEGLHRPFDLREMEIDGVGYVSPYAKALFVASASAEGVDVEETYMNFFNLPAGLNIKVGKMLVDTDTLNPLHQHAIPFVDRPLVLHHAFGTEGLKTVGGNVSFLVPNPWDHYLLVSGTAGANLHDGNQYSALYGGNLQTAVYSLRVATSWDLGATSYVNFNVSNQLAPLPDGSVSAVYLADMLLRYAPDPVSNALTFLNGVLWNRGNPNQTGSYTTYGLYNYLGWQFSPRWRVGARHDFTNNPAFDGIERQYTGILSFYPTETNYIRAQYARHQLPATAFGPSVWENEAWLQIDFTIGPHQQHTAL